MEGKLSAFKMLLLFALHLVFQLEIQALTHSRVLSLQGACDEAAGLLEVGSSAARDLAGSGRRTHVLKGRVLPL